MKNRKSASILALIFLHANVLHGMCCGRDTLKEDLLQEMRELRRTITTNTCANPITTQPQEALIMEMQTMNRTLDGVHTALNGIGHQLQENQSPVKGDSLEIGEGTTIPDEIFYADPRMKALQAEVMALQIITTQIPDSAQRRLISLHGEHKYLTDFVNFLAFSGDEIKKDIDNLWNMMKPIKEMKKRFPSENILMSPRVSSPQLSHLEETMRNIGKKYYQYAYGEKGPEAAPGGILILRNRL